MRRKFQLLMIAFILFSTYSVTHAEDTKYSNQQEDWYFKKGKNHKPASTDPRYIGLLKKYDGIYIGNTSKKELYLTFDNGYENGYTPQILDILKAKKVPATFFVTGHYLNDQPDLVKRMVKEGHIVGNHSWSHPNMTKISDNKIKEELDKVKNKFTEITGEKDMFYLRPPRGIFSERILALSNQYGYSSVFWSLAYKDWEINSQKGEQYAYDHIMNQIHPGAVLLLHTVSKDNAEALDKVIDELQKQGYVFKSLDELMVSKKLPFVLDF